MSRHRLLFYCQHSVGLGHLVRSLNLAGGLAEDFDVTLLNGGLWPKNVAQPPSIDIVHLPALGLDADNALVSRDDRYTVEQAVEVRKSIIMDCFRETVPDVVLIELFPFGRKKFRGELMPLLEEARAAQPAPFVACSLRDILVGKRDQEAHDDRASRVTNEYFDAVLSTRTSGSSASRRPSGRPSRCGPPSTTPASCGALRWPGRSGPGSSASWCLPEAASSVLRCSGPRSRHILG